MHYCTHFGRENSNVTLIDIFRKLYAQWLKIIKMSHLSFSILAFFATFCPIESDLSGNTV